MAVAWVQNICDQAPATDGVASAFTFTFTGAAFTSGHGAGGVCQIAAGAPALSTVVDNQSNSWTILDTGGINTSFGIARIPGTAPTSVTLTFASAPANANNVFTVIDEISGAIAINAHHATHGIVNQTTQSDNSTTTLTTMLLGVSDIFTTGVVTAGTGTLRDNQLPNSGMSTSSQTLVGSGPQTVTFNCSVADPFTITVFTIAFTGDTLGSAVQYVSQFPVQRKIDYRMLAASSKQDEQWPFTATPNPLKMQGIYYDPQFPLRYPWRRFWSADEQWPFTATPDPLKWQGIDPLPQFPIRLRQDPLQARGDEQWPFTAVPTPTQFGWDNPERFSQRVRFRPSRSADEQWPFTAVPTPGPLGWLPPDPLPVRRRFQPTIQAIETFVAQLAALTPSNFEWGWDPQFPQRIRFRPSRSADEQWPFTSVVTTGNFGWQLDPQFAIRRRFDTFQSADEQYPITTVPTPTQFGWQLDPQFAVRRRFRTFQSADDQFSFTATLTPSQFAFAWDPQFPFRIRFRPLTLTDEQWSFTATPTPTQFGWQLDPQVPSRLRFRPLLVPEDHHFVPSGTVTPSNIDFAYPPEFYLERHKAQPLIYDFWQPDIPPASPSFQLMSASATKVRTAYGSTLIQINLQGTGVFVFTSVPSPTILGEAFPFGSAHVVLTSGSTPVSVAFAASNDGVNFVQVGPAATNFPMIINLTSLPLLSTVPYAYHAWVVTGGDATTLVTITEIFMGWRG